MAVTFNRATKKQARLRMAIDGPSGSGKTYTALVAAFALAQDSGKVAVIDTEHGSASKYADLFPPFDVLELSTFHPQQYVDGIEAAEQAGYTIIIIDSLSHAWEGEGGVLELHDQATKRSNSGNSFTAWKDITPIHRRLVEAMLQSSCHIIATMRSKMEYLQTEDEKGKKIVKKVGLAPIQRQGIEYEMDIVADMDLDHNMVISKTRCFAIADQVVSKPTAAWFTAIRHWLTDGAPIPPATRKPQPAQPSTTTQPAKAAQLTPIVDQAKPTQEASTNGARPYAPEALKVVWDKIVKMNKDTPMADGVRGLTAAWLELCFVGQDAVEQKRHSLVRYLTDKESIADCTWAELRAFRMWLRPKQDSGGAYTIDAVAEQEAQQVITRVMIEAAQQELPLAEKSAEQTEVDADGLPSGFTGQGGK